MSKDHIDHAQAPVQQPDKESKAPAASPRAEIEQFLDQVKALGPANESGQRGRLIFALDATMSRQPTWDQACRLQADMFGEAAAVGGLDIQLVYYRGQSECRASPWVAEAKRMGTMMSRIDCRGGHTQIGKVLVHARRENDSRKVSGAGLHRRCHGGIARRSVRPRRRTWACATSRRSCSRRATIRSAKMRSAKSSG